MKDSYDVVIVGAGVIGCAIARSLSSKYRGNFAIIEKERSVGEHASSRNSGVIHSGFYYKPGSLKARFSVEGNRRLRDYCPSANVPLKTVGTLVIALNHEDHNILEELHRRGRDNGVHGLTIIGRDDLRRLEPHVAGYEALYSPTGAIINSRSLVTSLADDSLRNGVDLLLGIELESINERERTIAISTNRGEIRTHNLINCAGLNADRVAKEMGVGSGYAIIPFRGEYQELIANKSHLLNSMVYPTPDLERPFLGIHLTKTINGRVIAGPNAVLAPGREAYRNRDINLKDMMQMLLFSGFSKMVMNNSRIGLEELHASISKSEFVRKVRQLLPIIANHDLIRSKSGIRAQLVDRFGNFVDDLVVESTDRSIHILNAVSPGMTCSLPFADYVVNMIDEKFGISPIRSVE